MVEVLGASGELSEKMRTLRSITVGLVTLAIVAGASAQFEGPAPLAWRWIQPTKVPPSGAPLVSGDVIYTSVGSRVFAIDRVTGNPRWKFPLVDPIDGSFKTAPLLVGDVLVAAADNKTIYGINPQSGTPKWSFVSPSPIVGQPVQVGKLLAFATSDDKINVIDPTTGQASWRAPYSIFDGITGNLGAINNDILILTRKNEMISLSSLDPKEFNWHRPFAQLPSGATPVVFQGNIYMTSGPFLIELNGTNGRPINQVATNAQLAFTPTVSDRGVLVVTTEGRALLYDLGLKPISHTGLPDPPRTFDSGDAPVITAPTGDSKTKMITTNSTDLGSYPLVPPTAIGRYYIIPTSNGTVNLVDAAKGQVLWSYLVRPMPGTVAEEPTQQSSPGGFPGGPGFGGNKGGGNKGTEPKETKIVSIQASGPAVLAGKTLLVPARDGSILAFDTDLGVDLTPPDVTMKFPNPGDLVNGQTLDLQFTIEDETSGIDTKTLKVDIDGEPQDFIFTREGIAIVHISSFGKNKPLLDGRRVITITVSDWLGNETKKPFSLTIDNTLKPLAPPKTNTGTGPGKGGKGGGGGASGGD